MLCASEPQPGVSQPTARSKKPKVREKNTGRLGWKDFRNVPVVAPMVPGTRRETRFADNCPRNEFLQSYALTLRPLPELV